MTTLIHLRKPETWESFFTLVPPSLLIADPSPAFSVPTPACFFNASTSFQVSWRCPSPAEYHLWPAQPLSSLLTGFSASSPGLLQPILLTVARATCSERVADHTHTRVLPASPASSHDTALHHAPSSPLSNAPSSTLPQSPHKTTLSSWNVLHWLFTGFPQVWAVTFQARLSPSPSP